MSGYPIDFRMVAEGEGAIFYGLAGESVPRYTLLYLDTADGLWRQVDQSIPARMPAFGLAVDPLVAGVGGRVMVTGFIGNNLWGWTGGNLLYAGQNGQIVEVAPVVGDIQPIGLALNHRYIFFSPFGCIGGAGAGATAAQVWAFANRRLTNLADARAARIDQITAARMAELDPANIPLDVDTLLGRITAGRALLLDNLVQVTAARLSELDAANIPLDIDTLLGRLTAPRAVLLDNLAQVTAARMGELDAANIPADIDTLLLRITVARMAELDAANLPADIDTLLARLTVARAANLDEITAVRLAELNAANIPADIGDPSGDTLTSLTAKLGDPATALGAMAEARENTLKFPSAEILDDIALGGAQTTTERTITTVLPAAATVRRSMLVAMITIMNDTANIQKIDVTVQGRLGAGAWNPYWSENDCVGVPAVDAATTGLVAVADVSALVNAAAAYGFRLTVTQSSANSVHYTTQYVIVLTYRIS